MYAHRRLPRWFWSSSAAALVFAFTVGAAGPTRGQALDYDTPNHLFESLPGPYRSGRMNEEAQDATCEPGTGWTWTHGAALPQVAEAAELALAAKDIHAVVQAYAYGETDSCGEFRQSATDYRLQLTAETDLSAAASEQFNSDILNALNGIAAPQVGTLEIVDAAGSRSAISPAPDLSAPTDPVTSLGFVGPAVHRKVLLLVMDPILSNGQRLHTYMNWGSPDVLTQGISAAFLAASGNHMSFDLVARAEFNVWPLQLDGFRYTEATYIPAYQNRTPHEPEHADYGEILTNPQLNICGRFNSGEFDELWIYAMAFSGYYESQLVGPNSYFYNSPTLPSTYGCNRLLPIMGFNYERGVPEAIEDFGHRTESTMARIYGWPSHNDISTTWSRFHMVKALSTTYAYSGCGNVHFPPNGTTDYDWRNQSTAMSYCADYVNYPNLGNPASVLQPVTCNLWQCDNLEYFKYWFGHMPKLTSCTSNSRADDWWMYIGDPNRALDPSSPCRPDLEAYSISPAPSAALTNDDIRVQVSAMNWGGFDAGGFYIDLYVDDQPTGCSDYGSYFIHPGGVPANTGYGWNIIIPAGALSTGQHQLRAFVDSTCGVAEIHESNNLGGPWPITVSSPPPAPTHDDFNSAKAISSLAYSDTVSVSGATRAVDDPTASACNLARGTASVWYRYTPPRNMTLYLDTIGSGYDTYVAVWRGSRGSLTPMGCTDDIVSSTVPQSMLQVNVNAGTTYYIEVAQWTWPVQSQARSLSAADESDLEETALLSEKLSEALDLGAQAGGTLQLHTRVGHGTPSDYDRDSKSDPAKFIPGTGLVWWLRSSNGVWRSTSLGSDVSSYVSRSDFDGDGQADPAKFVQPAGAVYYLKSSDGLWGSKYVGEDYNTTASGSDFDGDGKTDFAKYLQGAGAVWHYKSSLGTWEGIYIGSDASPYLSGSDYDGDGKTDLAKYVRAAGAIWYRKSSTGTWQGVYIGSDGAPVAGSDFDGDGKTDLAKFLSNGNLWYRESSTNIWRGVYIGSGTYITASDFDGDGKTDPARLDASGTNIWYIKSSTGVLTGQPMGALPYQVVN